MNVQTAYRNYAQSLSVFVEQLSNDDNLQVLTDYLLGDPPDEPVTFHSLIHNNVRLSDLFETLIAEAEEKESEKNKSIEEKGSNQKSKAGRKEIPEAVAQGTKGPPNP